MRLTLALVLGGVLTAGVAFVLALLRRRRRVDDIIDAEIRPPRQVFTGTDDAARREAAERRRLSGLTDTAGHRLRTKDAPSDRTRR